MLTKKDALKRKIGETEGPFEGNQGTAVKFSFSNEARDTKKVSGSTKVDVEDINGKNMKDSRKLKDR